jgi:predicted ATP-binding protein involved in virulence
MHIDLQKKIVAIMQILNPKAQFILASHSPEIMADVADDKILSL